MPVTSGLSVWWSTPARPDRFFSAADLERSDRYHRPLRRMAMLATVAKVAMLFGACLLARGPLQQFSWLQTESGTGLGNALSSGALPSGAVLTGAALTVAALRLPAIAVDAWFEYRFRHGELTVSHSVDAAQADQQTEGGFVPAPVARFVITVASITVGVWAVLVVLGALGYWLVGRGGDWAMTLSLLVLAMLVGAALLEGPFRQGFSRKERLLTADDADPGSAASFDRLAALFGLNGLGLYMNAPGATSMGGNEQDSDVPNACAVGLGSNRRVVVTDALLREHRQVREFVVAHEFTHLARRHLLVQSAVSAAVYLLSIQLLGVLADSGRPWSWLGLSTADPLGMPLVALILLGSAGAVAPLVAWLTRAQERIADAGAIAALGPLPAAQALKLHAQNSADLNPPWWVRLYDQHPAPAERLEFLARHRQ